MSGITDLCKCGSNSNITRTLVKRFRTAFAFSNTFVLLRTGKLYWHCPRPDKCLYPISFVTFILLMWSCESYISYYGVDYYTRNTCDGDTYIDTKSVSSE